MKIAVRADQIMPDDVLPGGAIAQSHPWPVLMTDRVTVVIGLVDSAGTLHTRPVEMPSSGSMVVTRSAALPFNCGLCSELVYIDTVTDHIVDSHRR